MVLKLRQMMIAALIAPTLALSTPAGAACATSDIEADFYINGSSQKVYTGRGWWNIAIADLKAGDLGWMRCELYYGADGKILFSGATYSKCISASGDVPRITFHQITIDSECRLSGSMRLRFGLIGNYVYFSVRISGGQLMQDGAKGGKMATGVGVSHQLDAAGQIITSTASPTMFTAIRSFVSIPMVPSMQ